MNASATSRRTRRRRYEVLYIPPSRGQPAKLPMSVAANDDSHSGTSTFLSSTALLEALKTIQVTIRGVLQNRARFALRLRIRTAAAHVGRNAGAPVLGARRPLALKCEARARFRQQLPASKVNSCNTGRGHGRTTRPSSAPRREDELSSGVGCRGKRQVISGGGGGC